MSTKILWGAIALAFALGPCRTGPDDPSDLPRGTRLVYGLDLGLLESDADEVKAIEATKRTISARLELYGIRDLRIRTRPDGKSIEVQVPSMSAAVLESVKRQIEFAGTLFFVIVAPAEEQTPARIEEVRPAEERYEAARRAWVAERRAHDAKFRSEGKVPPPFATPRPSPPERVVRPVVESREVDGRTAFEEKTNQWGNRSTVLMNGEAFKVSGSLLIEAREIYDEYGKPAVSFRFGKEGAEKFGDLTGSNVGRSLAILLDGKIRQLATIKSRIYDQGQLTGNFTRTEVRGIVTILRGGSLPLEPKLIAEESIGEKPAGPPEPGR